MSRPFHLIVLWDEAVVAHDINPIQSLGILIFSSVTCSREFDVAVDSMEKKVIVFNTVLVSTDAVFPPWLFPILRVQTFAITHRSGVPSTITSRSDLHFWFSKTSNRSRIALAPRSPTKGGWQKKSVHPPTWLCSSRVQTEKNALLKALKPTNLHLLLLNVPQILITRVWVKLWENSDWPIWF